ncbi:MAG: hypothetical protein MHMPM18_000375, partial [Marteilia pararefringens]
MSATTLDSNLKAYIYVNKGNIKIQYEYLNKLYRIIQKKIEIQLSYISRSTFDLNDKQSLISLRNNAIKLHNSIKKYKEDLYSISIVSANIICSILYNSLNTPDYSEIRLLNGTKFDENLNSIFKSQIMHYFFEKSYIQTALQFCKDSSKLKTVEYDWFQNSLEILESIKDKKVTYAVNWMNENKNRLKKIDSKLEFLLKRQEYLQLVSDRNFLDAIDFIKKWPKTQSFTNEKLKDQLKNEELPRLLGLLVFSPELPQQFTGCKRYS